MLDFQERKKQIDALRERMQAELEEWASENEVLGRGEVLYFTLQVVKRDSDQRPRIKHVGKDAQTMFSEFRELTDADWEKIFSVDWAEPQRKALKKLQKRGNKLISYRQFFGNGELWGMQPHESFNYRFRKFGLPYRLRADQDTTYNYYEDRYWNIWLMPDKTGGQLCSTQK